MIYVSLFIAKYRQLYNYYAKLFSPDIFIFIFIFIKKKIIRHISHSTNTKDITWVVRKYKRHHMSGGQIQKGIIILVLVSETRRIYLIPPFKEQYFFKKKKEQYWMQAGRHSRRTIHADKQHVISTPRTMQPPRLSHQLFYQSHDSHLKSIPLLKLTVNDSFLWQTL